MDSRLSDFLARAESVLARLEPLLPAVREAVDWERSLAARWHRDGRSGYLQPLEVSLDLRLADLLGVERQREQLERNTRQFVAGQPANHALLWGARGTGKSSLVRALLAELAGAGLRLIEIERDHLADLPRVVEQLQGLPQRFVLFCDDLSFDAGEGDYRVLKSVLDGSLEQAPENVLLYATSNRRHLVSEKQSDNENWKMVDGELHPNEAVEDKIALSDRFGLWLSFYPFTQEHFLSVVHHWVDVLAEKAGLAWSWSEELEKEAIRWALGRGNRNGRCAYQFSRYWVGRRRPRVSRPHRLRQRFQQRTGGAPAQGRPPGRCARSGQPERGALQRRGPGRDRRPGGDIPAPDGLLSDAFRLSLRACRGSVVPPAAALASPGVRASARNARRGPASVARPGFRRRDAG